VSAVGEIYLSAWMFIIVSNVIWTYMFSLSVNTFRKWYGYITFSLLRFSCRKLPAQRGSKFLRLSSTTGNVVRLIYSCVHISALAFKKSWYLCHQSHRTHTHTHPIIYFRRMSKEELRLVSTPWALGWTSVGFCQDCGTFRFSTKLRVVRRW
jgi:hypothetical protein